MFFRNAYAPSTHKILIKESNIGLVSSEFEALRESRLKYVNNPLIGYLNIKSLRKKIVYLMEIILKLSLEYLVLSKTLIILKILQVLIKYHRNTKYSSSYHNKHCQISNEIWSIPDVGKIALVTLFD